MSKNSVLLSTLALALCVSVASLFSSCSGDGAGGVEVDDDTYPSTVSDLHAETITPTTVTLAWTVPGDIDTVGTATAYDMRFSKSIITWQTWDSEAQLSGEPHPSSYGSVDTMRVTGLEEDSTYFFALKTRGHGGNWSWMSNCVSAVCFDDFEVTFPDPNLGAIIRAAIGVQTGAIHRSDLLPLHIIDANDSDVSDLSGTEHCVNVSEIFLWNNSVRDVTPLAGLANLTRLQMAWNQIGDIDALAGLVNIEQLLLDNNSVTDISALTGMSKLTDVNLSNNQISDTAALAGKPDMQFLRLAYNDISDIGPLIGMNHLILLDLTSNQITSVESLNGTNELTGLYLQENLVDDVTALASLTKLVRLNLWKNKVTDIAPLSALVNLEELFLIDNDFSDVTALASMTQLKKLYLSFNPISDISALSGLTLVSELQLQFAQVVDISTLEGLINLQLLVLNSNQIVDIAPLVANTGLGSGDIVYLVGNPLSSESINTHIPALESRGVIVHF